MDDFSEEDSGNDDSSEEELDNEYFTSRVIEGLRSGMVCHLYFDEEAEIDPEEWTEGDIEDIIDAAKGNNLEIIRIDPTIFSEQSIRPVCAMIEHSSCLKKLSLRPMDFEDRD